MESAMMQAARTASERVGGVDAVGGAEGAGGEQERDAGDGDAELLAPAPRGRGSA